jgi:hypothetical protein
LSCRDRVERPNLHICRKGLFGSIVGRMLIVVGVFELSLCLCTRRPFILTRKRGAEDEMLDGLAGMIRQSSNIYYALASSSFS